MRREGTKNDNQEGQVLGKAASLVDHAIQEGRAGRRDRQVSRVSDPH
jgi:hypothetical protein